MAAYQKRSGSWRAIVRKLGVTDTATFPTKAQAQSWANAREVEIAEQAGKIAPSPKSVQQVLSRFADEVSPTRRGHRWELLRLEAFKRQLPAKPVGELTPDDLGKWRDERLKTVKASTFNRELNLLSAVLDHARREWRMMKENPARDVRRPTNPAHRSRIITDAERDALIAALGYAGEVKSLSHQVAVAFLLALETGMRAGEIVGLTWDRVHPKHVRLPLTKNGTARDVPLSTGAVKLLEKMRGIDAVQVFTVDAQSRDALFRRARNRCKLFDLTFHDSRHTAVTRLARVLDVMTLAKMIGHNDIRSLSVYYNPSPEDIAARLG